MTLESLRRRPWLAVGLLAAIAVAIIADGVLRLTPREEVPPDTPPRAVLLPDLLPLALAGTIRDDDLQIEERRLYFDLHEPS